MSLIESVRTRHRAAVAGVAATGVAAILILQDLAGTISSTLVGFSVDSLVSGYFEIVWGMFGFGFVTVLGFCLGVFASLWLPAPVSARASLGQAVLRSLLAAGIGGALVMAVTLALGLIGPMSGAGPLFGYSFPWPDLDAATQALTMAFQSGVGAFVRQAPVVVLVVILVWLWLQKHPAFGVVSAPRDGV